jgi:predicted RNA-binding protein associated with RNAse of E/G family
MGMHPPKVERFDVDAGTNTDPKGVVRAVDEYRVLPWGLYLARPADHDSFHYLESWILPGPGLRATVFHFSPGHVRDQDHYVDVGEYTREGAVWHSVDHYLDLVVRTGVDTVLVDTDELLAAAAEGLLDPGTAELAVRRMVRAVDGIAAHGHDLVGWLSSEGMPISWRQSPSPSIAPRPVHAGRPHRTTAP